MKSNHIVGDECISCTTLQIVQTDSKICKLIQNQLEIISRIDMMLTRKTRVHN